MHNNNIRLFGFLAEMENRGSKLVMTVQIQVGDSDENISSITKKIDLGYFEGKKSFLRKPEELWSKAYQMKCPGCSSSHRIPNSIVNALIALGEGTIKAQKALENHALDNFSPN